MCVCACVTNAPVLAYPDFSLQRHLPTLDLHRSWRKLQPTTYHITPMATATAYHMFLLRLFTRHCPPPHQVFCPPPLNLPKSRSLPTRKSRRESAQSPMLIGAMLMAAMLQAAPSWPRSISNRISRMQNLKAPTLQRRQSSPPKRSPLSLILTRFWPVCTGAIDRAC